MVMFLYWFPLDFIPWLILYFLLRIIIASIIPQLTIFPIFSPSYSCQGFLAFACVTAFFVSPFFALQELVCVSTFISHFGLVLEYTFGPFLPHLWFLKFLIVHASVDFIIPSSLQLLPSGMNLLNIVYPCTDPPSNLVPIVHCVYSSIIGQVEWVAG